MFPYRSSFGSRSVLVRFSIGSRSSFVHPPFILRSGIEDRSKNDRRTNEESSEARRRCIETLMGSQGKGKPNKKTPKIPHKPHAPEFQKKTLKKLSTQKTLKINTLPKSPKKSSKKLPKTFGHYWKTPYLCTRKSEITPTALTKQRSVSAWKWVAKLIFDKNYIKHL